MIGVGQKFPQFALKGVVSSDLQTAFKDFSLQDFQGQWLSVFFWPKDFTFVCPTEIIEYGRQVPAFARRNAKVLGISTDSEFVHLAWREHHPGLKDLPFPMLADIKRELSESLGILDPHEGVAQRASYLIDPQGVVRFVMVTDLSVGRNVQEILRILDALQTEKLCPCDWKPGEPTL